MARLCQCLLHPLHLTEGITQDALPKGRATHSGRGIPLNTVVKTMVSKHSSSQLLDSAELMSNTKCLTCPRGRAQQSPEDGSALGSSWSREGTVVWTPCSLY